MKVKMHNGTRSGEPLCGSCSHARIRRGSAIGQEITYCSIFYDNPLRVTYPIVECSDYVDKNLPSLRDMREIAHYVSVDKRTGKIGFVTPDKATEEMHDEVESPFKGGGW